MSVRALLFFCGLILLFAGRASDHVVSLAQREKLSVKGVNRLDSEKSPYLLQHKDNPVHWFAWGEEAFRAARADNKIIFLSIGYSTCHWCHVMEHDSFEREDVADVLNRDFISIKVDREERPDVDALYMDAVVGMTGSGGWPLSVFLTPDLKPFYGGTFFWRPQFLQLLSAIQSSWEREPQKVVASGEDIFAHLKQSVSAGTSLPDETIFLSALEHFSKRFDAEHGGFGAAPKFPPSVSLQLLLRIHRRTGDRDALRMVETTLDHMARGGMYDHLGGGFHRYSTDREWLVPHFEKMLYDNALLVVAYLEAFQVTGEKRYAVIARETLDYVLRDMTHPDGGFYSAEDADSEGEEGKFYVWTEAELRKLLSSEEFKSFVETYGVTTKGNFERGTNILFLPTGEAPDRLTEVRQKLFVHREQRVHPSKDDKILVDWNGLMISALAKGYQVLEENRYLAAAQKAARFLKENMADGGELKRRWRDGEARFSGMLNDYASLISALITLYESDFDRSWLAWAEELQTTQDKLFWDEKNGGYFVSAEEAADLIVRKKDFDDGAIPAANSVAALNLLRLFDLTLEPGYQSTAQKTLQSVAPLMERYPFAASSAFLALDYFTDRSKEIAVVGKREAPETQEILSFLRKQFLPNKTFAFQEIGEKKVLPLFEGRNALEGKTTVYVCENNMCQQPTTDIQKAKEMIDEFKRIER